MCCLFTDFTLSAPPSNCFQSILIPLLQLYALAADCSIGRAGSAILMTIHPPSSGGVYDEHDPSQLALIYLKLLPLTGNNDMITHFLCVQIDLPLTQVIVYRMDCCYSFV